MSDFIFDSLLPPEKMFVSLLSICETIPMNIKIIFSQHKFGIKARTNYKENTEKRIKKYWVLKRGLEARRISKNAKKGPEHTKIPLNYSTKISMNRIGLADQLTSYIR
jgi:hypothetical protein